MTIRSIWHEIPDLFTDRLMEFMDANKTGQVTLNIKDGKVQAIDIKETVRVKQ